MAELKQYEQRNAKIVRLVNQAAPVVAFTKHLKITETHSRNGSLFGNVTRTR